MAILKKKILKKKPAKSSKVVKKSKTVKKKILSKKPPVKSKVSKKVVAKKKTVAKPALSKKKYVVPAGEKLLGIITHYFPKVRAAVIKLQSDLAVNDMIRIKGHTTDFKQKVASIQIDHASVSAAKKGDEIGLQVNSRVRKRDCVTKI